jgi:LysM repeat protein
MAASPRAAAADSTPGAPIGVTFNPDAPASSGSGTGTRFMPTRPGTPVASTLVPEPVVDVTPATTYTVKSGDSLWSIAKKNHLTVAELTAANNLMVSASVRPGQKLVIPAKAPGAATTTAAAPAKSGKTAAGAATKSADVPTANAARATGDGVKHVVKSGETLGTIARIYGVKQGDIAVANNISDPAKIRAGMELIIPGWQAPVGKSGKSSKSGSSAAKSAETKAAPAVDSTQTPAVPPATPPPVPIIRIDDSPITPAPKP